MRIPLQVLALTSVAVASLLWGSDVRAPASIIVRGNASRAAGTQRVPAGSYTESVLYSFHGGKDGAFPGASLTFANEEGVLYGTTLLGGGNKICTSGCGTVFKLTGSPRTGYRERVVYRFRGAPIDGSGPDSPVVVDQTGAIYGTTTSGGRYGPSGGGGTAFKIKDSTQGRHDAVLWNFGNGADGSDPSGMLLINGSLYGETTSGGSAAHGAVYKVAQSGRGFSETILYSFLGGFDGESPNGNLLVDSSGALYGTTTGGGGAAACSATDGCGTVFKLARSANGYVESILYAFQGGNDGMFPENSGVVRDSKGALYGTTAEGGGGSACIDYGGCGTVFKLTPNGSSYTKSTIASFQGNDDGNDPTSGVILDKAGAVYGTTMDGGGPYNPGIVYELTPSGDGYVESVLYRFVRGADGDQPYAGLVMDKKGSLYGTTTGGGDPKCNRGVGCGTVFRLTRKGAD
jgi:uncharacterized repeat protein (TIGR03803 family)